MTVPCWDLQRNAGARRHIFITFLNIVWSLQAIQFNAANSCTSMQALQYFSIVQLTLNHVVVKCSCIAICIGTNDGADHCM